jgi:MFS family permease
MSTESQSTKTSTAVPADMPAGGLILMLGTVTGVQALATLAILSLATVAPIASESYGFGAEMIGVQVSIMYIAAASMSSVAGVLMNRWGAGSTNLYALLLGIMGLVGIASGNLALLIIGSIFIGCGYGLPNPAASHLLFRHTPTRLRNLVFSLKQTGVPMGGILAGLMLPAVTGFAGWQAALLTAAMLPLLLACVLVPVRRRWDTDRDPTAKIETASIISGLALIWRYRPMRGLAIMGFCFAALQLSLMAFVVTMLVVDLQWSLVMAGGLVALMQVFGALARIGWGLIADRIVNGVVVLTTIGGLSIAASLATFLLSPESPTWATAALLFLFGICAIGWNGVFLAEVARNARPGEVGIATGGALSFTFCGVVVGPALFAAMYQFAGAYTATFALMALFPALGMAALLIYRQR